MSFSNWKRISRRLVATTLAVSAAALTIACDEEERTSQIEAAISQSGEQRSMRRVGHVDLQGRPAYQPSIIEYPDGRMIAFVGTHTGEAPNPLNGDVVEPNGTMIIDVTNPKHPVEKFHIPVVAGQAQMARMCPGSKLPGGEPGTVYLMRNIQGGGTDSGYEVWDVTDVTAPVRVSALRSIRNTHKHWWECSTGIAYLPGSLDAAYGVPLWRTAQAMMIYDWKDPASPVYLRTHGLTGSQPSGAGPVPTTLHGPISTYEHPQGTQRLARGATETDIVSNRVYSAWGVGDDGVLQILDRQKLLPPPYGTFAGDPNDPTDEQLESAQVSIVHLSPDQGGHTSLPVFGLAPPSYQDFTDFKTRDIVLLASESTADLCQEAPHWSFIVDVTVENSITAPPGTRPEPYRWQGPQVLSTMWVDPRQGEEYRRGNYCTRGARFGVHSSEENFFNPFYGRLTFLAYFTGGVRVWDIREPHAPVEVAFYVPESNDNTGEEGYMTNNLEVDDRGLVYAVDRNGAGLDILRLSGHALKIGLGED